MREKAVVLVGGNSEIGNALASGIAGRHGTDKVIRISRTNSASELENTIRLSLYEDFINEDFMQNFEISAIVVAFGILESEHDYIEDLVTNFDVNVFQYLRTCENAIKFIHQSQLTELHITSSVLADFSRDSIFAYSQSKSIMEESILFMLRKYNYAELRIFIWKLSFVKTKMNSMREESIISTNLKSIETAAARLTHPGTYYLPKFAKYPSRILRHFPRIAVRLD